ncbi:unnamed protein product [Cylicostephanus goldi]|uniref:C2H2-type domain-containing protein n=1 Tax=Cylicostephanus goldi TaxID=71465 RepID=A0A3P6RDZ7_CYLGO|nr:unnamed protein product [Cylicostephanus goldi]
MFSEDASGDYNGEDLSECGPNELEDRFRCLVGECGKRFKCSAGLRLHSRTVHGVVLQENTSTHGGSNGSGALSTSQNHPPPTSAVYAVSLDALLSIEEFRFRSRPYKCHQCSKRYKTTAGLSNHIEQSHKKQAGCRTPSSTDSAPASPSPAVLDQLISQARAHGQAAQEQQRAMQRPLPVQVASATNHQYSQVI